MNKPKRLLVVVRWPLGGIRTYMRYVYEHLGAEWSVTILAADVQERAALQEDATLLGAELLMAPASPWGFFWALVRTLGQKRHELIQSQGFISAIIACIANMPFRKPHVLTVHGILEERLLRGVNGFFKRVVTNVAIRSVDVVYGVSEDILKHLQQEVPGLVGSKVRQVAILNGIEPELFLEPGEPGLFRKQNGLSPELFLFGFLGRFMPQKGFDKLVEALVVLEKYATRREYLLVAVGSGDFRSQYEAMAQEQGVAHRIVFLPFQRNVSEIYRDLDAVVMPSNWEACPLQPMEALVSGVPLITSDCIGLREVVRGTPALVVPDGNPTGLAQAMDRLLCETRREHFAAFRQEAARRFDVRMASGKVSALFDALVREKSA